MKKIFLSLISLSLIALVAVFSFTNTNTLLIKNAEALAQDDPDRPPFNCPDTGDKTCFITHLVFEEDGEWHYEGTIVLMKP